MKKQTKAEKIIAFLIKRGSEELPSKSRKYRKFTKYAQGNKTNGFYFVGKNGALRAGRSISSSISLTGKVGPITK